MATTPKRPRPDAESLLNSLKESLSCKICNGISPEPVIYQCKNGHDVCQDCFAKIKKTCPTCRARYLAPPARNRTVEALIREYDFSFPCPNKSQGCQVEFPGPSLKEHAEECPFRVVACPWPECNDKVRVNELLAHLKTKEHKGVRMCTFVKQLDDHGETFLLCLERVEGSYFFWVYILASQAKAGAFESIVGLSGDDGHSLQINDRVYSIHTPKQEVKRDCVCLGVGYCKKFMPKVYTEESWIQSLDLTVWSVHKK